VDTGRRTGCPNPADQPWSGHDTQVLIVAAVGIAIVVLLIVRLKMHAFLALTIGAFSSGSLPASRGRR
jgi:GntP family gluconate:H+ symporter